MAEEDLKFDLFSSPMGEDDLNFDLFSSPMGEDDLNFDLFSSDGGRSKKLGIEVTKEKEKRANDNVVAWLTLKSAIILNFEKGMKNLDSAEPSRLRSVVDDICVDKGIKVLYKRLNYFLEYSIADSLETLRKEMHLFKGFDPVAKFCEEFMEKLHFIEFIFSRVDKDYAGRKPNAMPVEEMVSKHFMKHFELDGLKKLAVHKFLEQIARERSLESDYELLAEMDCVNHISNLFVVLGIYKEDLEKPFLKQTAKFYQAEGRNLMQTLDVLSYLKHVETRLKEEQERCRIYLYERSDQPLLDSVGRELLEPHVIAILDKGFTSLMEGRHVGDLQRMYMLFSRVNELEPLRQSLNEYILRSGRRIVLNEEEDNDMLSSLLEFLANLDKILKESFNGDTTFSNTIRDALFHLAELREKPLAELIANFMHEKFGAGSEGTSEEELDCMFEKVALLFRIIQDKDMFEALYRKKLVKRILLGRSVSIDAEKSMISKLKTECGDLITSNLEGMLKDIESWASINESFKQSSTARPPSEFEIAFTLLSTMHWPTPPAMEVHLPGEVNAHKVAFREFYSRNYVGRKLNWQDSLSHCVLKSVFPNGERELVVTALQAAVLLMFNDTDKLSFEDIKNCTGLLEDEELRMTLQSLACGEDGPLEQIIEEGIDFYVLNDKFNHPASHIELNASQLSRMVKDNVRAKEPFQDRKHQIDSAVVRIMKKNKVLSHQLLKTEVLQEVNFPVGDVDIKIRIEILIAREFLKRDTKNPEVYNYIP